MSAARRTQAITSQLRPQASGCGSAGADHSDDDAAIRGAVSATLRDMLWNIPLCVDGADVIHPQSRLLALQLAQYFGPFDDATADRIGVVLTKRLGAYQEVLEGQYFQLRAKEMWSSKALSDRGLAMALENLASTERFTRALHTQRKVMKLLARAHFLRGPGAGGDSVGQITAEQKEFLLEAKVELAAFIDNALQDSEGQQQQQQEQQQQQQQPSQSMPESHGLGNVSSQKFDVADAAAPGAIPEYACLYETDGIMCLLEELCGAMGIGGGVASEVAAELYMTLTRQMVVFVSTARMHAHEPNLKSRSGGAGLQSDGLGLCSSFDLDHDLRFGAGCCAVRQVFGPDFIARAAGHIEVIGGRQSKGVVHFVSSESDVPSRRIWDCLENDGPGRLPDGTVERTFLAQLRNPCVVAINATVLGTQWRVGSMAINETIPGSVGQEAHIDYTKWRK
jgi:hypothetical protein